MKQIFLFFTIFSTTITISTAQNRITTRGAEPGELYFTSLWYFIYNPIWGPPYYDTVRMAVFHVTENGKKLTIQYDADYFANPEYVMFPTHIIADATPGALYSRQTYSKNSYPHTALWVSFDYGKNWVFREENIGSIGYVATNVEGVIFRHGMDGAYKSEDYGNNFNEIEIVASGSEPGLQYGEAFSVSSNLCQGLLGHTYNFYETYTEIPIDSQYVCYSPDVYRGGFPGEVYVRSEFLDKSYKVSFSSDTGHTFRHVYISENHSTSNNPPPRFMSDREPGVFYIIKAYEVEDASPWGGHGEFCIEYYRDYGETLEAIFCHDIHKNYEYEEVICDHFSYLESQIINQNAIQLQWSSFTESSLIRGYHVYRNNTRITSELLTDTVYLDENLSHGNYDYYVRTYYTFDCVSDSSNHVTETIGIEACEPVSDLSSEMMNDNTILLTWSEPKSNLFVEGYNLFRNEQSINEHLIINTSYTDEELPVGNYEYYVVTYYSSGCISDSSNHVEETIELGIKEFYDEITVYPNPTIGELTINNEQLTINNITVFDVYGRMLKSKIVNLKSKILIDISHLHAGIYFLKITTVSGITTQKIIKY